MKKTVLLFAVALLYSVSSCKCETKAYGTVFDIDTQTTLDSVVVRSFTIPDNYLRNEMTTELDGKFVAMTGRLSGSCENLKVIYSRPGYRDTTIIYAPEQDHSDQTVYLTIE